MGNKELIAKMRARATWRDTDSIIDALLTNGANALERAEAELAKYRSAPVVDAFIVIDGVMHQRKVIIRPEAP